nr:dATP/dGTP pyrophosphohydrolase domain-containing protein [Xanthomonas arboricola]
MAFAKRQQNWSLQTFGPGYLTESLVDHIQEELIEVEQSPRDSGEWADLVLLALDGLLRCTGSAELAAKALSDKADINLRRAWPDWRTVDRTRAIGHIAEPEAAIDLAVM